MTTSPPQRPLTRLDLPVVLEVVAGAALAIWLVVEVGPLSPAIISVAAGLLLAISYVWGPRHGEKLRAISMIAGGWLIFLLFWPQIINGGPSTVSQCHDYLMQIGLGMHLHHEKHGALPPAVFRDSAGRPMHSWQPYLLPFLDQKQALFEAYAFDEPWDGPSNQIVAAKGLDVTSCPAREGAAAGTAVTNYFYVVGEGRWAADDSPRWKDMTDGPDETILLVETRDMTAGWTEPAPMTVDDFLELARTGALSVRAPRRHDWAPWPEGVHVVMANGAVLRLRPDLDEATWRALLTPDGGEPIELTDLLVKKTESSTLRMIILTAAFVLIVAWRHRGRKMPEIQSTPTVS